MSRKKINSELYIYISILWDNKQCLKLYRPNMGNPLVPFLKIGKYNVTPRGSGYIVKQAGRNSAKSSFVKIYSPMWSKKINVWTLQLLVPVYKKSLY